MAEDTRLRSTPKRTPLPREDDARLESEDRRTFFRRSAAVAGGALAAGGLASAARGAPLMVPLSELEMGRPIDATAYGMPSKFEKNVVRRRTDVFVNRQNWSDWSMTPLQDQLGIIDAERADLRAPSCRDAGHRPGDAPPRHSRHGPPAAAVHDG